MFICRAIARIGFTNHLNIGAFMEKGLSMRAGQTPVQKYMHQLRDMVLSVRLAAGISLCEARLDTIDLLATDTHCTGYAHPRSRHYP